MIAPFPETEALNECQKIIDLLDAGFITIETVTQESAERSGAGVMLGVLVCVDSNQNRIVLKTISGISHRLVLANGLVEQNGIFVPPIVSAAEIESALAENDVEIHRLTDKINFYKSQKKSYSEFEKIRIALCEKSLKKVHALYAFHCIDGSCRTLSDIVKNKNPPTGTGDCCAPKLLDYAFSHSLQPISMAEVFYGKNSDTKMNGHSYPPCDERCGLLLPAMLGLKIVFADSHIVVIEKNSGLLSVPGRGADKQDCVVSRFKKIYPHCIAQPAVHRLDMETSGLMVLAITKEAHRELSRQFADGEVKKQYEAVLDGNLAAMRIAKKGEMTLYFRLDVENRPHQMWDSVYGKKAITEWEILGIEKQYRPDNSLRIVTRVLYTPHTGRTHQLRLASADSHGFGVPIVGDSLYGTCNNGERLLLHARYLCFTHPATGKQMEFFSKCPF